MASGDNKYSSNKLKPGKTKAFFICVLIASFLWVVHSLNAVYNYTIQLPVAFKNMPQNKKSQAEIPKQLSVSLKASGLKLLLILLNKPFEPVEIDFNNLKSNYRNQNYILSASDIDFKKSLRFETQIKRISPDTLYFSEKTGYQKTVPVKVPLFLKCREGFAYRKPLVSPAYITIWGDTTLINKIDTLYTQALSLNEVDQPVKNSLPIIRPGNDVYTVINEATITVDVARLVEQSLLVPVSVMYKQAGQQVNIYPSKVRVKFTSLQNSFDIRDTVLFRAVVNSDKPNPVTKKHGVFLSAQPSNITVMGIEPKEVEILILKN